ncbi:MAG: ribbon-helix-helix domain-containing protein [Propionibacteriaceae bacterium]|nr:ribbon-helix-helix domain-containing protein [Propionibacteriaceae bacterium]
MSTLDRRVQVLFDPEEYSLLEDLAHQESRSVGSIIRESVRRTLSQPAQTRLVALERLLTRADAAPVPVGDWHDVKDGFERDTLQAIR